jgi:predicted transcriptional regulator
VREKITERKLLNERRSDANIIVEILKAASAGAKKTEIVYRVNLNFKQVRKYLDFLGSKGLIFIDASSDGKKIYRSTDRGKAFVKRYRETIKLLA